MMERNSLWKRLLAGCAVLAVLGCVALSAVLGWNFIVRPLVFGGPSVGGQPLAALPSNAATNTPTDDLGRPLGLQPMIPIRGSNINWDQLRLSKDWEKRPGLTGEDILYFQTGKPNTAPIPNLDGNGTYAVPPGVVLMWGTFSGDVQFASGNEYAKSNGFYVPLLPGTELKKLVLSDGFAALVPVEFAQQEYCLRIAQAVNQNWARSNLFRPASWSYPVCVGVTTTVIDPNG